MKDIGIFELFMAAALAGLYSSPTTDDNTDKEICRRAIEIAETAIAERSNRYIEY